MKRLTLLPAGLLMVSLGLLASCDKKDPEATPAKSCLLTQTTATYMHHDSVTKQVTEYLYNADSTLVRSNVSHTQSWQPTSSYTYYTIPAYREDGKMTKLSVYNSKETTFNTPTFTCEYDEEGLLSRQIFEKAGMANTEFIYNDNKKMILINYVGNEELLKYTMLTWDTLGNVVKEKVFTKKAESGGFTNTYTCEYKYDNKKNPLKSYYFDFVDEPISQISANNIVWKRTLYNNTSTSFEETYQYTYNEQDYPVQQTSSNNIAGRTKIDFVYTCK